MLLLKTQKMICSTLLFCLITTSLLNAQASLPTPSKLSPDQKVQLLQKAQETPGLLNTIDTLSTPAQKNAEIEISKPFSPAQAAPAQFSKIENLFQQLQADAFSSKTLNKTSTQNSDSFKQFGYDIFQKTLDEKDLKDTFSNASPGADYVLGVGDALTIQIWGKIEEQLNLTINKQGQIFLPKVGLLTLSGQSLSNAEKMVKQALSKYYINFEVSLSVGALKSIQVYILGEANAPGLITIPARSSLITALQWVGGPTKMGTLRNIQLIKNKRVVRTIDLYDYLLTGKKSQDPILENFDTIFIPVIGDTIKIGGLVKRPGIFELKNQTNLDEAIETFAGGPALSYYAKRIQIERIEEGKRHYYTDIDIPSQTSFKKLTRKKTLQNGDVITLLPILSKRFNEVYIVGNVGRPGTYEYTPKMTLGELITKAENILADTYFERIEIIRETENGNTLIALNYKDPQSYNTELQEFDTIKIYNNTEIKGQPQVKITGAVSSPGTYDIYENMRLIDLIFLGKPTKIAELRLAELIRKNPQGQDTILKINIAEIMESPNATSNILVQEDDTLVVQTDPIKTTSYKVKLMGQFRYPGDYNFIPGETLASLIKRAGGLTDRAFLPGTSFKRETVKELETTANQKLWAEEQTRLIYDAARIESLNKGDYKTAYDDSLGFIQSQLSQNSGRIVLEIKNLDDLENLNLVLEDGDQIAIPETPTTVQIIGGVQQQSAHMFTNQNNALFYINLCGGFSEFARRNDIYIIKPNGTVVRDANTIIERGDTIYIPEEIKTPINWLAVLQVFTSTLTQIITTVVLVNSLK